MNDDQQQLTDELSIGQWRKGFICPMCGRNWPHQHSPEEVTIFGNGRKYERRQSNLTPKRPQKLNEMTIDEMVVALADEMPAYDEEGFCLNPDADELVCCIRAALTTQAPAEPALGTEVRCSRCGRYEVQGARSCFIGDPKCPVAAHTPVEPAPIEAFRQAVIARGRPVYGGVGTRDVDVAADIALYDAAIAVEPGNPANQADVRAICEALGFDPTNHHSAAKCPYCHPAGAQGGEGSAEGNAND